MPLGCSIVVADPIDSTPDLDTLSSTSTPHVIVRLAGLPAQVLKPLTSPVCVELLDARESLDEQLGEVRWELVEAIAAGLIGFDAATRRFLLEVRRSCYNGREIGKYRGKAEWAELLRIAPSLAERIVILEEQLVENDCTFLALYESELGRERRHVLDQIQDRRFLRGVALGRPGLVQKVRARAPFLAASGFLGRITKWEQSLLRFTTRAAVKLSANSTLTAYALGSIEPSSSAIGFHFVDLPQREVSLVRANRPELEQFQALLMRHPTVRERALIAYNDSIEEFEPGRYRFLRAGDWDIKPGADRFHYVPLSKITVELSNPLLREAQHALRESELPYNTLLSLLGDGHGISKQSDLDQLIDLGLLILIPPWPAHEAHLERRIRQFLQTLPHQSDLCAAVGALDQLLVLEESFASAACPENSVAAMEAAFSQLLSAVLHLAGHRGPLTTRAQFCEDVFFQSSDKSGDAEMFQIADTSVQEILHSANLILRFATLFNHRHDILHTLAAWWRENEPARREIPFTEVVKGFAIIWKQYLHFHKTANESALNTFDPLHVPTIEALRESRERLLSQSKDLLSASATKDFLPEFRFGELLEALPRRYTPLLGACVFVQPIDAEGNSWVLNRINEGTGRYLSRFTAVLEGPVQQRLLDHLAARSVVSVEGEEADLLEVMHPWGTLLNAHPPQAAKILDFRGLHLGLPRERRVGLCDLIVHADLDSETFRLIDRSGRRVFPVHLSAMADAGLPPLLRFLLIFGPGETRGVYPFPHSEGDENLTSFGRLTCGRLVVRRRRWAIDIRCLRGFLEGLMDARAYACIQGWRRQLNLPRLGFYYESTYHGTTKPQYVDFTSPSLCSLFIASLRRRAEEYLIFEEALPLPADFPVDAARKRRGLELLIDSLAVRAACGNTSASVLSYNREINSLRKEP